MASNGDSAIPSEEASALQLLVNSIPIMIHAGRPDGYLDFLNQRVRIMESPVFAQSGRLGKFLRFTVESALDGKAEALKEYVIGTNVYGRKPPYQPAEDSIVRSEARRLRRKLKEFYDTVGNRDPVVIHYRPGSYVPAFEMRDRASMSPSTSDKRPDAVGDGPELRVAVLPFVALSVGASSTACARLITDDLIHELVRTDGVLVTSSSSPRQEGSGNGDSPSPASSDVHIVFEGTVGEDGSQLRVTIRIVNPNGLRIWSEKFETDRDPQRLFDISARIASALISRICSVQPLNRKDASARPSSFPLHPLILRAEALLDEGSLAATQTALAKWKEVLEIDPRCVRAICGIAQSYCELALRGVPASATAISNAAQAAEEAVQLDSDLIEASAAEDLRLLFH